MTFRQRGLYTSVILHWGRTFPTSIVNIINDFDKQTHCIQEQLSLMKNIYTIIGHFLLGVCDSISLSWIRGILFYTDPITGRILPQSIKLQRVLLRSIIQAGVITTLIPYLLRWLGFSILSWIVMGLSLIWTFAYLSFYNADATRLAQEIIVWKAKKTKEVIPQLDVRQKIDPITDISNQIQSFIFRMAFYTPVSLLLIVFSIFDQIYFPWMLAIMDCFFNTVFYYFRKWPYDKYNVAFLESHMSYALGFGAFVSIATDILLPSPLSISGYLLISQWMIINALYHNPPQIEFNSFMDIIKVFKGDERKKIPSAYNVHRKKLRQSSAYRNQIMQSCYFMRPFFMLTAKINGLIQKNLFKNQFPERDSDQFRTSRQTTETIPETSEPVSSPRTSQIKQA